MNKKNSVDDYYEEKVPVFIPRKHEGEEQITVTLNGVNYLIQCAKQVMVPRKVAMVIKNSNMQEENAYRYISGLTER
ncbi:MAG: hypothetical protein Q8882_06015 [Bacillota bacterium]|nr:hypothetical protein [Bacillota bacterium]